MTPDQARQRAEKSFRQEERARDAQKAMAEYEAQAIAIRKKTAHLKALRLAKETQGSVSDLVAKLRSGSRSVGTPSLNRRKIEDQRRQAAEKEAAARRETESQVLEDAERLLTIAFCVQPITEPSSS